MNHLLWGTPIDGTPNICSDMIYCPIVISQPFPCHKLSSNVLKPRLPLPAWIASLTLFMDIFFFLEVATRVAWPGRSCSSKTIVAASEYFGTAQTFYTFSCGPV